MKKLTIQTANLLKALQTANKAINKTSVLPILESLLFNVQMTKDGPRLLICSTDLELSIFVSLPCEAKEAFMFTVFSGELKLIEKLECENVDFILTEKQVKVNPKAPHSDVETKFLVRMEAGTDKVNSEGENPLDFPKMPVFDYGKQLVAWVKEDFQSELKTLLTYISKDDLRPQMTGVFFETLEAGYNLTATDAHLLKTATLKGETLYNGILSSPRQISAILPAKFCKIVSSFSKVGEMLLAIQDENFFAQFEAGEDIQVTIVTRSIQATFPDYTAVIPQNNPIELQAEIKPLLKLISKAAIYSNKTTYQGILSVNGDIKLSSFDLDFSKEYSGQMDHITHKGTDIEIGLNLNFFSKILKDVDTDTVIMEFSSPTRAAIVRNSNGLTLLMPVMINN